MSAVFSFYRLADGVFTGRVYRGAPGGLVANTPAGCAALDGAVNPAAVRVDLVTGQLVPYTPPGPSTDDLAKAARRQRNAMLAATDWTQVTDAPLSTQQRADWATHRQALRDVPEQPGFPESIEWPAPPQGA